MEAAEHTDNEPTKQSDAASSAAPAAENPESPTAESTDAVEAVEAAEAAASAPSAAAGGDAAGTPGAAGAAEVEHEPKSAHDPGVDSERPATAGAAERPSGPAELGGDRPTSAPTTSAAASPTTTAAGPAETSGPAALDSSQPTSAPTTAATAAPTSASSGAPGTGGAAAAAGGEADRGPERTGVADAASGANGGATDAGGTPGASGASAASAAAGAEGPEGVRAASQTQWRTRTPAKPGPEATSGPLTADSAPGMQGAPGAPGTTGAPGTDGLPVTAEMPQVEAPPATRKTFEVRTGGSGEASPAAPEPASTESPAHGPTNRTTESDRPEQRPGDGIIEQPMHSPGDLGDPSGTGPSEPTATKPGGPAAPGPGNPTSVGAPGLDRAERLASAPTEALPQQPSGRTAERSGDPTTEQPSGRTTEQPTDRTIEQPSGPAVERPSDRGPGRQGDGEDREPSAGPRHMRAAAPGRVATAGKAEDKAEPATRRRRYFALAGVPVVLLVLLIVAWTLDTTVLSGQVVRNVEVAGQSIGGKGEDSLPEIVSTLADELAARPVTIQTLVPEPEAGRSVGQTEERTYTTTAALLGLTIDEEATIEAALDVGRDDAFFVRPFKWLASFFSPHEVPLRYQVNELQTVATLQTLQGPTVTPPVEPTIQLTEGAFTVTPGQAGSGIDAEDVVDALPEAAEAAEGTAADDPLTIEVDQAEIEPRFSDEDAQAVADRANDMTAQGLTVQADTASVTLSPEQLRGWITPTTNEGGLDLAFNGEAAKAALPELLGDLGGEPQNATVTLEGGTPVVQPGRNGVRCCGADPDVRIWDALTGGQASVELEAEVAEPEHTTEEVEAWGITAPVGGSRAWQNGGPVPGPAPGFTTYHNAGEARVTNIHRIADLVRGAVIPPGESFSVNDHVGERTTAKGFVPAGAIRDGIHVQEVGGGVSQFATTLFNAAYFAGLDITTYQAHTEYFSRYPRGREATMGYPAPDLVIENNTPYGVLIWTSYTGSSLTVTMWSTPYAAAEQTGITESPSGACVTVTTTRTRTYPDGRTEEDRFRATYRPGEGLNCNGQPITPPTP